jgi:hypothetical protein
VLQENAAEDFCTAKLLREYQNYDYTSIPRMVAIIAIRTEYFEVPALIGFQEFMCGIPT